MGRRKKHRDVAAQVRSNSNLHGDTPGAWHIPPEAIQYYPIADSDESDDYEYHSPFCDKLIGIIGVIRRTKAELDALSAGSKDIPKKLGLMACELKDYHKELQSTDKGPFLEALRLVTEARDLAEPNDFDFCISTYFQSTTCQDLYSCTQDKTWLDKAIVFGRESVDWWTDNGMGTRARGYTLRCENLATSYKMLYDADSESEFIDNAALWQDRCAKNTIPVDYDEDEDGNSIHYNRYKTWINYSVLSMDHKSVPVFQDLIKHITEDKPLTLEDPTIMVSHNYWQIRLGLYCRQWAATRAPDHLKALRDNASALLAWEANDPYCDCHGNTDAAEFCADPTDPNHVIRRAAGFFDEWFRLDSEKGEWSKHLPTIDTSTALWEEVYNSTPRIKFIDLLTDETPVKRLEDRYAKKYSITESPDDGWQADDKEWESRMLEQLLEPRRGPKPKPSDHIKKTLAASKIYTVHTSYVMKQGDGNGYGVWAKLDTEKPWNLTDQRFKFLTVEEWGRDCTTANWIRYRSDEGIFVLGGAKKGQDDDLFEFLRDLKGAE